MVKKYVKVKINPSNISIVENIEGVEAYREALKRKRSDEQIWKVDSFESVKDQINTHNKYINDNIDHSNKPTPSKTYKPTSLTVITEDTLWDWTKTDKKTKKKLKDLYKDKSWGLIMKIHNDLKLTKEFYCCDSYVGRIITNIDKAIEDGII